MTYIVYLNISFMSVIFSKISKFMQRQGQGDSDHVRLIYKFVNVP